MAKRSKAKTAPSNTMIKALTEIAAYVWDKEQEDYLEWCEIEGLDPKDFLAPDQRRHIFTSVLVVSGYKKGDYSPEVNF